MAYSKNVCACTKRWRKTSVMYLEGYVQPVSYGVLARYSYWRGQNVAKENITYPFLQIVLKVIYMNEIINYNKIKTEVALYFPILNI